KVLMIPLGIKQQKGMIANARMQPKMQASQKMYGNNKQKYSEELQKLYDQEHFSPLSSCLPMLIQFPILFGMLDVIYYPIKHMLRLPADTIAKSIEIAGQVLGQAALNGYSKEYPVFSAVKQNAAAFINGINGVPGIGAEATAKIADFDFTMFGLFLGDQPTLLPGDKPIGLYLVLLMIPILSGVTSMMMSLATMKTTAATTGGGQAASMSNTMMLMMPLMSVWISFVVPAGVGIYWLISNVCASVQTVVLNKLMNPAEEVAKAQAEEEERRELERLERIEAKRVAREQAQAREEQRQAELAKKGKKGAAAAVPEDFDLDAPIDERGLSQKEINRRKLARARKRDAERYGEEYVAATDDDIN
ncbi:MAG: YidC/Oxa1 family membrane protein insertase, partial [Oscillospiraceae bacterium]